MALGIAPYSCIIVCPHNSDREAMEYCATALAGLVVELYLVHHFPDVGLYVLVMEFCSRQDLLCQIKQTLGTRKQEVTAVLVVVVVVLVMMRVEGSAKGTRALFQQRGFVNGFFHHTPPLISFASKLPHRHIGN